MISGEALHGHYLVHQANDIVEFCYEIISFVRLFYSFIDTDCSTR